MKKYRGFCLLKPDCFLYVKEFLSLLKENNFDLKEKYFVENYSELAIQLYKITNYIKCKDFYDTILVDIDITTQIFGNKTILLILSKQSESLQTFLLDLDKLKSKFRKTYSVSKQKKLVMFANTKNMIGNHMGFEGKIVLNNENSVQPIKYIPFDGNWTAICFYMLHSCDKEIDFYEKEMSFIDNKTFIKLTNHNLKKILKYKTFQVK